MPDEQIVLKRAMLVGAFIAIPVRTFRAPRRALRAALHGPSLAPLTPALMGLDFDVREISQLHTVGRFGGFGGFPRLLAEFGQRAEEPKRGGLQACGKHVGRRVAVQGASHAPLT